jgi:hypothetical protein
MPNNDINNQNIKKEISLSTKNLLNGYMYKFDDIATIVLSNKKSYLGNIRFFEIDKIDEVKLKLTTLFNKYGKNSFNFEEITPCCSPNYILISFKIDVV